MKILLAVKPRELAILVSCVEQCAKIQETADSPNQAFIVELKSLVSRLEKQSSPDIIKQGKGVIIDA